MVFARKLGEEINEFKGFRDRFDGNYRVLKLFEFFLKRNKAFDFFALNLEV